MENLKHDIKTVLITREQIAKRVREMGQQITKIMQARKSSSFG